MMSIIGAEPGTYILEVSDSGEEVLVKEQVLAWEIEVDDRPPGHPRKVRPITAKPEHENPLSRDREFFGYLMPDGRVQAQEGTLYEDLAEAERHIPDEV